MDHPSIIRILEDDEADESQYSGAEVDAFTAELNRDISGSAAPSSHSDHGNLSHANNQIFDHFKACNQPEEISSPSRNEKVVLRSDGKERSNSEIEPKPDVSVSTREEQQEVISGGQNQPIVQSSQSVGGQYAALALDKNQVQIASATSSNSTGPTSSSEVSGGQLQPPPTVLSATKQQNPLQQNPQGGPGNMARRNKLGSTIPFAVLLPILCPQLDKDKTMQLHTFYDQLKKNEITKEHFLRLVRHVVGDQMLKVAVQTAHMQEQTRVQAARGQLHQAQPQSSSHQPLSSTAQQSQQPTSSVQVKIEPSGQTQETGGQKFKGGISSEAQGLPTNPVSIKPERDLPMTSLQSVNKSQQLQKHHFHPPPASYAMYAAPVVAHYNPHQFAGPSTIPGPTPRGAIPNSQIRQVPPFQSVIPSQGGSLQPVNPIAVLKYETNNIANENKIVNGGSIALPPNHVPMQSNASSWQSTLNKESKNANMAPLVYPKQEPVDKVSENQLKVPHMAGMQRSSTSATAHTIQGSVATTSSNIDAIARQTNRTGFVPNAPNQMPVGGQLDIGMQMSTSQMTSGIINGRTPQKQPAGGQKKVHELLDGHSPANKKQKIAGAVPDQSIEQLNDVTAVSGVNLREEEEQLFSASKDDNRVSEATRKVAQAEEERLILQRAPLRKKIMEIMNKHGIKESSSDVDRCLSLGVEERLRGLITKMIRVSKQRVDLEKPRHGRNVVVTSDVRRQILMVNRKTKEEWDKKQAEEAEKQRKLNEVEGTTGDDTEKDETRPKAPKANKEEDDKMRTTAANVAARAAVGGDDVLSKWQLMAEQSRQKREGSGDASVSSPQFARDVRRTPLPASGKPFRVNAQDTENRGAYHSASGGMVRSLGRSPLPTPSPKIVRSICVKDMITVLERELHMSKSNLVYRLYERNSSARKD